MRRFSIAGLMAVVLVCGVAVAALRNASEIWAGILLLLTLGLLAAALLGVAYRREAGRAGWIGFALFGWGYLTLAFGPWFAEQVRPQLPTTRLLDYVHGKVVESTEANATFSVVLPAQNQVMTGSATTTTAKNVFVLTASTGGSQAARVTASSFSQPFRLLFAGAGNYEPFQRVGHCLFALLAGLVGAIVARRFHAGLRRAEAEGRG
jgi:hypothetical protein